MMSAVLVGGSWDREPRGMAAWARASSGGVCPISIARGPLAHHTTLGFIVQDGAILENDFLGQYRSAPKLLGLLVIAATRLIAGAKSRRLFAVQRVEVVVAGGEDVPPNILIYQVGTAGWMYFFRDGRRHIFHAHSTKPRLRVLTLIRIFSCLTRLFFCRLPEDLLPAIRDEHLYGLSSSRSTGASITFPLALLAISRYGL